MSGMFLSTESSMKGIIFFSSFLTFLGCDSTQRGEGPYSLLGARTELLSSPLNPGICHKPIGCFSHSLSVLVCQTWLLREKTRSYIFSALLRASPLLPTLLGRSRKELVFSSKPFLNEKPRNLLSEEYVLAVWETVWCYQRRLAVKRFGSAWACRGREILWCWTFHKECTFSSASYTSLPLPLRIFFLGSFTFGLMEWR